MNGAVPVPRPLRQLSDGQLGQMLIYMCRQLWLSQEDHAVLAAALGEAQADMAGDEFNIAGALLATAARAELAEPVGQRAAWVGALLFLHMNRRPAPRDLDQDAVFELVSEAATWRIGGLETGARLRTLWRGGSRA